MLLSYQCSASTLCAPAQVQPVQEDQLMTASGNVTSIVSLAALSESLDYLADAIHCFGDSRKPKTNAQVSLHYHAGCFMP